MWAQNSESGPAARRSRREKETWLLARGMPSASASARWAASKLVTPMAPISPSPAQAGELVQGVEPGRVLEAPPVELQEVEAGDAEAGEAFLDAGAHHLGGHRAGLGAPFGERDAAPAAGEEAAGDELGAAVVVGHVEGVEAVADVGFQRVGAAVGVDGGSVLLEVGDLPEAADHAGDRGAVLQSGALRVRHGWASSRVRGRGRRGGGRSTRTSPRMPRGRRSRMAQRREADEHDLQRGGAGLLAGGEEGGDDARGDRPEAPDHDGAEDGAAVVAGAADDQHRPDLEGEHRQVVLRRDEADEVRLHRAGEAHDRAADGEGLEAEAVGALAEGAGGGLVLADGAQDAAPGAAEEALEGEVEERRRRGGGRRG